MKINDIIFDSLNDLEPDIIKEAASVKRNGAVSVKKRTVLIRFAAAAACIALIAAVQYRFFIKPVDDACKNSNVVSEEKHLLSQNEELLERLKEYRTEHYPLLNYCMMDRSYNIGIDENNYYFIDFLKNKDFEKKINADIKEAMDECRQYYDESYITIYRNNEEEYSMLEKTDWIRFDGKCQNGYLSVVLYYYNDYKARPEHIYTLNYDLIREKEITDFSELFEDRDNYLAEINRLIEADEGEGAAVLSDPPECFTIAEFFDGNGQYQGLDYGIPGIIDFEHHHIDWGVKLGFIPACHDYDMSSMVDEEYIIRLACPDNCYSMKKGDAIYTLMDSVEGIGESDTELINEILLRLEDRSLGYMGFYKRGSVDNINIPYKGIFNFWGITVFDGGAEVNTFIYDPVTEERMKLSDILTPEGAEYMESFPSYSPDADFCFEFDYCVTGDNGIESVGVSMIRRESTHPEYTNIWLPVSYIRPEYIFSLHDDIPDPLDK